MGMHELCPEQQETVQRARRRERFLTQPLFVTKSFTGQVGGYVPLEDTLAGCEAILNGELSSLDESHIIGSTAEAPSSWTRSWPLVLSLIGLACLVAAVLWTAGVLVLCAFVL